MNNLNQAIAQSQRQVQIVHEQMRRNRAEEIERQERTNELLEINTSQNEQMIQLKEKELDFLGKINEDTKQLVNLLKSLEQVNILNGKIIEANMLEIERRLDEIITNTKPENLQETLINEVKNQTVEKGVNYGIQFLITGIKTLIASSS